MSAQGVKAADHAALGAEAVPHIGRQSLKIGLRLVLVAEQGIKVLIFLGHV